MASRMRNVSQSLLGLLGDADGEVVSMSLHVFTNMLQHKHIVVSSTTAPKLAEALLLLFDHDNSHVQLLSIQLFRTVMESVVDEGKKPLKTIVNRNLYALLIYCHDENCHVAKVSIPMMLGGGSASRETLLCAAKFLERRNLEQLVEKGNLWKFAEVLVPAKVKNIHQSLVTYVSVDARLQIDLATLVIWVIVQVPECHEALILYSSRLFAVQVMKALLGRLWCDNVVEAMEHMGGWDTLLCADSQHYAVGLLAREMLCVFMPLCSRITIHMLRHLSREDPCWDLPFLAFLVEVLQRLDLSKCGGSVLRITSRYLQGECSQRRRLALRGLVVPSKDPSMASRMRNVSQSLLGLLGDADGEVVSMSLHVFTNMLQHKHIVVSSTTAPKLAEALLLLFDHDNSHVQLLSIQLFRTVMESVVDEGKKPLKTIVNRNLYALLIYCHDENCHVAKASQETLLRVAEFLKRRNLEQLVEKEQLWKFAEVLVRTAWKPQAQPGEAP
ncbi:maestro heat-like repeat-containing protein family member 6 [Anomalospiza imberbis]|uniref:maestro heat-like repeat-containing protein family member 6 n=1 Tax=Anomalospiza imberbis TaxID=187417 RepID=UPI00358EF270